MNMAKVILETVLENRGAVAGSPIEFSKETRKWFFWDESSSNKSKEYDTLDEALLALEEYCKHLGIHTSNGETGA